MDENLEKAMQDLKNLGLPVREVRYEYDPPKGIYILQARFERPLTADEHAVLDKYMDVNRDTDKKD